MEEVIQKHREIQDQIAEDMLTSIKALKSNTLMAKGTIEGDAYVSVLGRGVASMQGCVMAGLSWDVV